MRSVDMSIIGKRYGRLVVLDFDHMGSHGNSYWLCECDCGEHKNVSKSLLTTGKVKSCGCLKHERRSEDLTGKRFGRLRVIGFDNMVRMGQRSTAKWKCICDCGNVVTVSQGSLLSGDTISCGCYRNEKFRERVTTHGLSNTPLYTVWNCMKQRCENSNDDYYQDYGARGIRVCDEWHDFENFNEWGMTNGYSRGLTIDRIDNNGNYSPDNCRWADMITQANNRRSCRYITYAGNTHTIAEWARLFNISYFTLWGRINRNDMRDFENYFGDNEEVYE